MGSCRMGNSGPMGPGVSMGPMSSEAQSLPSNVISKQSGSMEVILMTFLRICIYFNIFRQNCGFLEFHLKKLDGLYVIE